MPFRSERNLPSAELADVPPGHWRLREGNQGQAQAPCFHTITTEKRLDLTPARPHRAGVFLLLKAARLTVGCVKVR